MDVLGDRVVYVILGALIGLIGLVHVFEGVRTGPDRLRQRSWTATLLGAFEIGLGLVLLLWREEFSPIFYAVVRSGRCRGVCVAAPGITPRARGGPGDSSRALKPQAF
jgi:hypothetical protein